MGPHTDFESRFSWRQEHWVQNLADLAINAQEGGSAVLIRLPALRGALASDRAEDALRWSILILWLQAAECFVFGQFEPCILTCGAVLERILKLEYLIAKGPLPKGLWTLGKCIRGLNWRGTRITDAILAAAEQCVEPRNSRAHGLLEHSNPQLAITGGPNRRIYHLSEFAYIVEPFRGEALDIAGHTWSVLEALYGQAT